MLDKKIWKQISAAIISCTLIAGTSGTNTALATSRETSITGNIKQEEKSSGLSRILTGCKEVKGDNNQIKTRKGEAVSVKSIVNDGDPSAVIMSNGDLYCWGWNGYGVVGNGEGNNKGPRAEAQLTPVKVLDNVKSAVCSERIDGHNTMTAITENGDLYCWGWNGYGTVGNGKGGFNEDYEPEVQLTPVKVLDNVKSIDCCCNDTLMIAITENGDLYCWGLNDDGKGKVGNGTTENQLTPVKVLANVKSVYCHIGTMTAITENGDLYCWGDNDDGQVGNGTTENQLTPVKVLDNVKSVNSYNDTMTAITENRDLYCWGNKYLVGNGEVRLNEDGEAEDQLTPVKVLDNVKSVNSYNDAMTAITENGDLYCWGYNGSGQVGNGTTGSQFIPVKVLANVKSVYGHIGTMTAITENGDLYCWGNKYLVGNGEVRLNEDGEAEDQLTPVKVLDNVKSVKGYKTRYGYAHITAITENGDLYCWGDNKYGQVGNGTTENQFTPVKVLDNVKSVECDISDGPETITMTAITENGDLYRWWGTEDEDLLEEGHFKPVKMFDNVKYYCRAGYMVITKNGDLYNREDGKYIKLLGNVKFIFDQDNMINMSTYMAITENGDLYCWGDKDYGNDYGQVGNGTTEKQVTPVKILPLADTSEAPAPTDTETPPLETPIPTDTETLSPETPIPTDTPITPDTSDIETGYKVTVANLKYTVTSVKGKQTVEFIGGKKTAKSIVIPSSIDIAGISYKVVSVANNACKNYKKLQKVTIGANINSIGNTAFSGCTKLKKIIFKTKKLTAGKTGFEAFKGVNKKVKVEGPKSKVKAYTRIVALKR